MKDKAHSAPSILFAIVTSRATRRRALAAYSSWCAAAVSNGGWCHFFADLPFGSGGTPARPAGLRWTVAKDTSGRPSASACCRDGRGFFCSAHRQKTLAAQYRFLPALALAKRSAAFTSGRAQWVVLLDDDSFVFVRRLRRLLTRYSPEQPLMLGEFRSDRAYACGGAGAVLSRGALEQLDLDGCVARTRHRCLQSDWQLGECVRHARPSLRLEARHGCGTCATAPPNCTGDDRGSRADGAAECAAAPPSGCHFMQEAGAYAQWVLQTANCSRVRAPSIVHGAASAGLTGNIASALARRRPRACPLIPTPRVGRSQLGLTASIGQMATS